MTTCSKLSLKNVYEEDGVALVRSYFPDKVISTLEQAVDENIRAVGSQTGAGKAEHRPRGFIVACDGWRVVPAYSSVALGQDLIDLACLFLGVDEVTFLQNDLIATLAPQHAPSTPWHQDLPYYPLDCNMVSFWLPLNRVAASSGPHFIKGSHRWGRKFLPVAFDASAEELYASSGLHPPIGYEFWDHSILEREGSHLVTWELAPGDVIVFNGLTLHGLPSPSRTFPLTRLTFRYVPGCSRIKDSPYEWEQLELAGGSVAPGSPLAAPLFVSARRMSDERAHALWREE